MLLTGGLRNIASACNRPRTYERIILWLYVLELPGYMVYGTRRKHLRLRQYRLRGS